MSGANANWWMDASCRWHPGAPPPGWRQARNGRWHPPSPDDTTDELTTNPPVGGAHLASGGRGPNLWQIYRSWPRWARRAGPTLALILVVGLLGAAATGSLWEGGGRETTATSRATTTTQAGSATSLDAATPAPTASATTTASSVTGSTTPPQRDPTPTTVADIPAPPPPTTADQPTSTIHRGAPCSPEGATAFTSDGIPMVCTTQKCHGAPFSEPRWRPTSC
jgi:hypothetical protein